MVIEGYRQRPRCLLCGLRRALHKEAQRRAKVSLPRQMLPRLQMLALLAIPSSR